MCADIPYTNWTTTNTGTNGTFWTTPVTASNTTDWNFSTTSTDCTWNFQITFEIDDDNYGNCGGYIP